MIEYNFYSLDPRYRKFEERVELKGDNDARDFARMLAHEDWRTDVKFYACDAEECVEYVYHDIED